MKPPIQIVIEGQHFPTVHALCTVAMGRGFTGSRGALAYRIKNGATTWAELLAPPSAQHTSNGHASNASRAARRAEEKALMAQLCAELDARKAAIKDAA